MTIVSKPFLIDPLLLTRLGCYQFQPLMPHPGYQLSFHIPRSTYILTPLNSGWWLGLDSSLGSQCAFCPAHSLDPLGHHTLTCKCGGDIVLCHNVLLSKFKPALGSFPTICSHNLPIFCCRIGTLGGPLPWTSPLSHC